MEAEREQKEAERELRRSENMIRYKADIESRPKKEWFMGHGKRSNIAKESKEDLKNIKNKFENYTAGIERNKEHQKKKRDKKRESKKQERSDSKSKGKPGKKTIEKSKPEHKFYRKKKQLFKKK